MEKDSNTARILDHLQQRGSISPLVAWRLYHTYRLSSVILRLRRQGHHITTRMVREGKSQYAVYIYENKTQNAGHKFENAEVNEA